MPAGDILMPKRLTIAKVIMISAAAAAITATLGMLYLINIPIVMMPRIPARTSVTMLWPANIAIAERIANASDAAFAPIFSPK